MRLGNLPSVGLAVLLSAALLPAAGCKKDAPPGEQPAAEASAAPAPAGPRCSEKQPGAMFLIGDPGPGADDADQAGIALPFAAEPGDAVGYEGGFAVTALRTLDGGQGAAVGLVSADAGQGQLLDLGAVNGSVIPPRLASSGKQLVVAVADSARQGRRLRLGIIQGSAPRAGVQWGAEYGQADGDSQRFGLAVGATRGVLAWDEYDSKLERGAIRAATFALDDVATATEPRTISPEPSDVEGVQVVSRPGGYWVAWISHSSFPQPATDADAGARPTAGQTAPRPPASSDRFEPVVDLGRRWLEIVAIDDSGVSGSAPVVVTDEQAHVLVFDLASGPDGSAWLAWRDDRTSPGVEKRSVHVTRVRPDGSRERQVIRDEHLGAGAPSLLVDVAPPPTLPQIWLAVESVDDEMRIAALDERAHLQDSLEPDPLIRRAEPVALHAGGLLLARPRGRAVELSVVTCRAGGLHPPAAASAGIGLPAYEAPPEASSEPPPPKPAASR